MPTGGGDTRNAEEPKPGARSALGGEGDGRTARTTGLPWIGMGAISVPAATAGEPLASPTAPPPPKTLLDGDVVSIAPILE